MPDPKDGRRRPAAGSPERERRSQPRFITDRPNTRHHLALLVALGAAFLIAVAIPISSAGASSRDTAVAPVPLGGEGLTAVLLSHAEAVAEAVVKASVSPTTADQVGVGQGVPGARLVPKPLLAAAGRLAARGMLGSPQTQASFFIPRQEPLEFSVHQQGFASQQVSSGRTVGQALADLGIRVNQYDRVTPAPDTPLSAGLHVFIRYASRVEVRVAGEARSLYTHAATVRDLLAEAGVPLEPLDRVSLDINSRVRDGLKVEVTVVRQRREYVDDPIAFDTIYRDDSSLLQGKRVLVQAGRDGSIQREYLITTENGVEVSRELVSETTVPPRDEVIARGTAVPTYSVVTPQGDLSCARTMRVYATWYTAASAGGGGYTATGLPVSKGIVAVDPGVIPLGTRMYVPGYGYGLAADTGGGVRGYMIDLAYGAYDVFDWSTRWVDICILG